MDNTAMPDHSPVRQEVAAQYPSGLVVAVAVSLMIGIGFVAALDDSK